MPGIEIGVGIIIGTIADAVWTSNVETETQTQASLEQARGASRSSCSELLTAKAVERVKAGLQRCRRSWLAPRRPPRRRRWVWKASLRHARSATAPQSSRLALLDGPMPSLSGTWLMSRYEGDLDGVLYDAGVTWSQRQLAKAFDYGVGALVQVIKHVDEDISIDFQAGTLWRALMQLRIGAGKQEAVEESGDAAHLSADWQGACLVLEGSRTGTSVWYLDGSEMVVETTSETGLVARRFYSVRENI